MDEPMDEFTLIARYFQSHRSKRTDVVLGIGDDCALLQPPADQLLAVTTDTQSEGSHFFAHTSPFAIGYRALAVSLSDLAAMGAQPAWALLSLSLPKADPVWLEAFSAGFFRLLDQYGMQLVGGNTTRGPLSVTTQVTGFIPSQQALCRSGAKPGDGIYVTGSLGGAGLAVLSLAGKVKLSALDHPSLLSRFELPEPRVEAGMALRRIASSAIDISDGLAADLGHILQQSGGLGAKLELASLPLFPLLKQLPSPTAWELALSAGDDYELCFTVPPSQEPALAKALRAADYHRIGVIEAQPGLRCYQPDGELFPMTRQGFQHF